MKSYEVMYIAKPMAEEELEKLIVKMNTSITNNGGIVDKTDFWGKKRLAYEVQDFTEGMYVLVTFNAEPKCVAELDRVLKITEDILRFMIIRKGE